MKLPGGEGRQRIAVGVKRPDPVGKAHVPRVRERGEDHRKDRNIEKPEDQNDPCGVEEGGGIATHRFVSLRRSSRANAGRTTAEVMAITTIVSAAPIGQSCA